VSVAVAPTQIVGEFTAATIVPPTVTVDTAVEVHPKDVPVTVYEVVVRGVTEIGLVSAPFDQEYVVAPAAVNVAVCVGQIVADVTVVIGCGLTVMVNELATPGQVLPTIEGVTVIVDVTGSPVILVATNAGKFVVPLAAKPIEAFELVHANVAPAGVLKKVLIGTVAPAQTVMFVSGVTIGLGVT
jgi:hypothetical protein